MTDVRISKYIKGEKKLPTPLFNGKWIFSINNAGYKKTSWIYLISYQKIDLNRTGPKIKAKTT